MPPRPSMQDLRDAIESASMVDNVFEIWEPLENFKLEYLGKLTVDELSSFDDLSSWLEDIEDEEELSSFRGNEWQRMANAWGNNPPPIVVVTSKSGTTIGDGRGRVTYAAYKDIPLHVWELTHKEINEMKKAYKEDKTFELIRKVIKEELSRFTLSNFLFEISQQDAQLVDSTVLKHKLVIVELLKKLGWPKEMIRYHANDNFAELRHILLNLEQYETPKKQIIKSEELFLDPSDIKDREKKFQDYISGKQKTYFRNDPTDPRTLKPNAFLKLPPITVMQTGNNLELIDGIHRAFLAKKLRAKLPAWIIKQGKNHNQLTFKMKTLFNS